MSAGPFHAQSRKYHVDLDDDAESYITKVAVKMRRLGMTDKELANRLYRLRHDPSKLALMLLGITNTLLDRAHIGMGECKDTSNLCLARILALTHYSGWTAGYDGEDDE